MAKFTIPQVESNIDNGVTMEHLDVFKDYMEKRFNENVEQIMKNFLIFKAAIEGEDRAISHLGVPHEPSDVAPTNPNKYDWYLNTKDQTFYMFVSGVWKKLATLSSAVDLSDYYTIEEANEWFLAGSKGTLKELHDIETGKTVEDQDAKYINIVGMADILNDQKKVDKAFLANFEDKLIWKSPTEIDYLDTTLNMPTLQAEIFTNGNTATYTTLISPYDRISQFQANFEATLSQELAVQYQFISKSKAIKFNGNVGDTYKWDHIQKYEGDKTVDYLRFTGSCTLQMANNFQPGIPSTWETKTMPFEIKLEDLITDTSKTAIVEMDFPRALVSGTELMKIKYLTSTFYIENRFKALLKDVRQEVKDIVADPLITPVNPEQDTSDVKLHYAPYADIDSAANGTRYFIDVKKSKADAIAANGSLQVKLGRELGTTYFDIVKKISTNAVDKTLNTFKWQELLDNCDHLYLEVEKAVDFGNADVFVFKGWRDKSPSVESFHVTTKAYTTWDEIYADRERLVSMTAYSTEKIDWFGAAIFAGESFMLFNEFADSTIHGMRGAGNMSNNAEYEVRVQSSGVNLWNNGAWVGNSSIPMSKFTFVGTLVEGVGFVKGVPIDYTTLRAKSADAGKALMVGTDGRIILGESSDGGRLFELARANARNEAINEPTVPIATASSVYRYKKGVTNDFAKALHNLQIIIFDDDNKVVYSTEYSPINKIDYSINIPIKMNKNDTLINYDVTIEDKDLEGIAANTITVEENAAGSGVGPNFKYEIFIIDRDATLTETRGNALYDKFTYDLTEKSNAVLATEQIDSGVRKFMIPIPHNPLTADKVVNFTKIAVGQSVYMDVSLADGFSPQLNDLIFFNGEKVVTSTGVQLRWSLLKNTFSESFLKFQRVSDGVEFYWQWVGSKPKPLAGGAEKFEPRQYDYSSTALGTTLNNTGGKRYIIITQPADAPNTPVGATNKILFNKPTFPVQDTDQVTYGSDLIWIYKNATDIMTWDEVKDHIADEEKMVIKHLASGHWELVRWEAKGVSPAVQKDINNRLTLNLDNIKTDAEKIAFINGLKAIGVDVSLFGEFKGVLDNPPATAVDKDWYISTTDYISHVYHSGGWHQMSVASGGMTKAQILTALGLTEANLTKLTGIQADLDAKQDTMDAADVLTLLGITQAQMDALKTLEADLLGKQDTLTLADLLGLLSINQAQLDKIKTLTADLAAKQDTLTKTITLTFDDNTTEDIKVG